MKEELLKIIDSVNEDTDKFKDVKWEETLKNLEFPKLEGSEKQVKWANDIKSEKVKRMILDTVIDYYRLKEAKEGTGRYEHFKEIVENSIEEIEKYINQTSAKVIIETR